MPYECEVTRKFTGAGGHEYKPGEIIDASGFRHLDLLVQQRKLRPVAGTVSDHSDATPPRTYNKPATKGAQHAHN